VKLTTQFESESLILYPNALKMQDKWDATDSRECHQNGLYDKTGI
jgi:hypothetical protein